MENIENQDIQALQLKAMGDRRRLAIIHFLASHPGGEATVNEITEAMGISQPAVSQHLKILQSAGLLQISRRANFRYYRIQMTQFRDLTRSLRDLYQLAVRHSLPQEKQALKEELKKQTS